MTFFESLLILLLVAVVLMQLARKIGLPYPSMLVLAGVGVALIPGAPTLTFEPATALALFIAPALVDAAFDYPLVSARRFWAPLVAFGVVAVLATALLVAWIGWAYAGLPIAVAVALGAIVAPPDAAAATAVLGPLSIPRTTDAVIKGESLFNDATALLLFGGALAVQSSGGRVSMDVGLRVLLAAPGGIAFGWACAWVTRRINPLVSGTLRGSLLQFITAFSVWIVAEHLHLSAVLAIVAFSMTMALDASVSASARARVHSFAVWASVVFVLNVFAFLMMGMQARTIALHMAPARLIESLEFAGIVVVAVILVRLGVVIGFNRFAAWRSRRRGEPERASWQQGVFVGWCGMRGLVTLATAFALPADFPQRDLVEITAFAVVFATLVLQGITLIPLLRWLGLDQSHKFDDEMKRARERLLKAALGSLQGEQSAPELETLQLILQNKLAALSSAEHAGKFEVRRRLGLASVAAQREELEALRAAHEISTSCYDLIQEDLDWQELTLLPEGQRRIEQG